MAAAGDIAVALPPDGPAPKKLQKVAAAEQEAAFVRLKGRLAEHERRAAEKQGSGPGKNAKEAEPQPLDPILSEDGPLRVFLACRKFDVSCSSSGGTKTFSPDSLPSTSRRWIARTPSA